MIEIWATLPQDLQLLKLKMMEATGLGKDALHIYVGLAIFVAVRLLWRWRGGWVLAWFAVLALACTIEWFDMRAILAQSAIPPDGEHWHDIWNTMFWPTILLLTGSWIHPKPKPDQLSNAVSGDLANQSLKQPPSV